MSEEALIAALSADLQPVRRLPRPGWRALGWLGAVVALGAVLALLSDMGAVRARMESAADLRWATVGSVATAACAAFAAFQLSVPGRSVWWMALPVPASALWLGASGWGCLREWGLPGPGAAKMGDAVGCAAFIMLVSLPLSGLLLFMLRRACPLWPGRIAALGGLAAAAAAASLLTLFHPYDASAVDVLMHVLAVGVVVMVSRGVGAAVV